MGRRPKHSERGKAWPKDGQPRRRSPLILNRNTRRLLEQVEGMTSGRSANTPRPGKPKK